MRHRSVPNPICPSSLLIVVLAISVSAQSGGPFEITESVIANGVESSNGNTRIEATSGQAAAGGAMRGGQFAVTSGFWSFSPLAPTAAMTSVSGRVATPGGRGIRNALLTLTAPDGTMQTTATGSMGYFEFREVVVGQTYFLNVSAGRFTFNQPTIAVTVVDQITDILFVGESIF